MQKYVNQLLQDIKQITLQREKTLQKESKKEESKEDFMDYLKEVDQYVSEIPKHNMYYHFNIEKIVFPPAEKLTDLQMASLIDALKDIWAVHRFACDYPAEVPIRIIYPLFLETMDEPVFLHTYGVSHLDFCSSYPPDCPYKEYCTCQEIWDELEDDDPMEVKGTDKDELPF